MKETYGVLRVVRVQLPANAAFEDAELTPTEWLAGERFVYVLTNRETSIGRALSNDILLMDPTVSREHARLVVTEQGWCIFNLTMRNTVCVNGRAVPAGGSLSLQSQDMLILGHTTLQLIAPQKVSDLTDETSTTQLSSLHQDLLASQQKERQLKLTGESAVTPLPDAMFNDILSAPTPLIAAPESTPYMLAPSPTKLPGSGAQSMGMPASPVGSVPLEAEENLTTEWEEQESLLGGVTMQFAFGGRRGNKLRWLLGTLGISLLAIGAVIILLFNTFFGVTVLQHGVSSLLLTLFIPLIPAGIVIWLVNVIDRYEREPWFLRLAAFLWGGIIAIPLAQLSEGLVDAWISSLGPQTSTLLRSLLQGLNPGITEEALKGLGLVLLFYMLRDEFDNVTDGFVYGALIGAGFALTENFLYFATNVSKGSLPYLIVARIVLGWLTHPTFTVCIGVALGYVRHTRVRWQQWLVPAGGFLLAVLLHSAYDFVIFYAGALVTNLPNNAIALTVWWVAILGNYIPPFVTQLVLLYILVKSLAHEATVVREFLASEVSSGVIRVDEYALLQSSFQRAKAERKVLRKRGLKQWLRVRALYQTEIGLAFRKWHVSMGDEPKPGDIQPEDVYRQRIRRLRQELEQTGT